jgi:hypothetical protein
LAWALRQRGMPARQVTVDCETPMLLPPDLLDRVPADHLVPFMIDVIGELIGKSVVHQMTSGSVGVRGFKEPPEGPDGVAAAEGGGGSGATHG